jgi:ketosteroid isomerase-like protein
VSASHALFRPLSRASSRSTSLGFALAVNCWLLRLLFQANCAAVPVGQGGVSRRRDGIRPHPYARDTAWAMSQENVDGFRKAIAGYNRGAIGAMLEITHPEAEWYPFTAAVEGNEAYHGHEGLRRWWANVDASFDQVKASVDDIRDLGDELLALGHLRARFRSGVTLDTEIAWLVRYRDGLAVWGHAYQSHADALEAAGLS